MTFWGCAQIAPSTKDKLTLQQVNELSCLSSFGKGRLTSPQRKVVFEYESLYEKQHWKMSLMLPVHGQELLAFRWKAQEKNKKVVGQFAGRAVQALKRVPQKEGAREAKLLKESWTSIEKSLSLFFASLESPEKFCGPSSEGFVCRSSLGEELRWTMDNQEASAFATLNEKLQLELRLLDKQQDGFRRFELFVYELPKGPQSRPTLGLELFASRCNLP